MRLMGIDYGAKRIGVALTDTEGRMAFPHATYQNDTSLLARIVTLCKKENVGVIVVGKSQTLTGAPNPIQKGIDRFVAALRRAVTARIVLEPEHLSTQAALRVQGRTAQTDASAAALILESYLSRHQTTL